MTTVTGRPAARPRSTRCGWRWVSSSGPSVGCVGVSTNSRATSPIRNCVLWSCSTEQMK